MNARGLENFRPHDPAIHPKGYITLYDFDSNEFIAVVQPGVVPPIGSHIVLAKEDFSTLVGNQIFEVRNILFTCATREPDDQLTHFAEAEAVGTPVPTLPTHVQLWVSPIDTEPQAVEISF